MVHILAMASREEGPHLDRLFTLEEANCLIPQLQAHLTAVQQARSVLRRTKHEISLASANAHLGGGSPVGAYYLKALQQISQTLQALHEQGVLVKDLDMGLCDFPYLHEGRVVYLCWKLGEREIKWWHEINSGYTSRQPLSSPEEA